MLKYKTYVKRLMLILLLLFGGSFLYVYHYAKSYPIPLFHRISLDAKMKFIRDMERREAIDTIIVGSSIGLNNLQGLELERSAKTIHHLLNFSALGLQAPQIEQLSKLFSLFPNLKRVIYSAQYEDWSGANTFESSEIDAARTYLLLGREKIDLHYTIYTYKHLLEFAKNHWQWEKKYRPNTTNHGLSFDASGSVPLEMYGDKINHKMYATPPLDTLLFQEDYQALQRVAKALHKQGIAFYFIAEPYRAYMLKHYKEIAQARRSFIQETQRIVTDAGGVFLDLHPQLHLGDAYFADREHLNSKGSLMTAKAVATLIDRTESKIIQKENDE